MLQDLTQAVDSCRAQVGKIATAVRSSATQMLSTRSKYSDFIVLLARQRSGTNALRSILAGHPDIFCLNEVFNLADRDSPDKLKRDTNFFTFVSQYSGGDVSRLFPDKHETLFCEYFDFLRTFSQKRMILLDVKYNSAHFFTPEHGLPYPFFYALVRKYGIHVLQLTRRNYLRWLLSQIKAEKNDTWGHLLWDNDKERDRATRVAVPELLETLRACAAEDRLIRRVFAGYDRFFACDYRDIFPGAPPDMAATIEVQLEIDRAASEPATLLWSLNNGTSAPITFPAETINSHQGEWMETPLEARSGAMSFSFESEPDTRFEFRIAPQSKAGGTSTANHGQDLSVTQTFCTRLTVEGADDAYQVHSAAILPACVQGVKQVPTIRFQVRYWNPNASEAVLVWGLNDWAPAPNELPIGTHLTYNNTHMNTPMARSGNAFVFEYEVPAGTRFRYAALITRLSDGTSARSWQGKNGSEYSIVLSVADANVVIDMAHPNESFEVLASDQSHLDAFRINKQGAFKVRVSYRNPQAGEVQLVWGLNHWSELPDQLPAETVLTHGGTHLNTPMWRQGDEFVLEFDVKANSLLHYAFHITRTSDGQAASIYRGDTSLGCEYLAQVSAAGQVDARSAYGPLPSRYEDVLRGITDDRTALGYLDLRFQADRLCSDADSSSVGARIRSRALIVPSPAAIQPGGAARSVLRAIASWIGVSPHARSSPAYSKLASLTLSETIKNYDEVVAALAGTEFEYCLDDERPFFRRRVHVATLQDTAARV